MADRETNWHGRRVKEALRIQQMSGKNEPRPRNHSTAFLETFFTLPLLSVPVGDHVIGNVESGDRH